MKKTTALLLIAVLIQLVFVFGGNGVKPLDEQQVLSFKEAGTTIKGENAGLFDGRLYIGENARAVFEKEVDATVDGGIVELQEGSNGQLSFKSAGHIITASGNRLFLGPGTNVYVSSGEIVAKVNDEVEMGGFSSYTLQDGVHTFEDLEKWDTESFLRHTKKRQLGDLTIYSNRFSEGQFSVKLGDDRSLEIENGWAYFKGQDEKQVYLAGDFSVDDYNNPKTITLKASESRLLMKGILLSPVEDVKVSDEGGAYSLSGVSGGVPNAVIVARKKKLLANEYAVYTDSLKTFPVALIMPSWAISGLPISPFGSYAERTTFSVPTNSGEKRYLHFNDRGLTFSQSLEEAQYDSAKAGMTVSVPDRLEESHYHSIMPALSNEELEQKSYLYDLWQSFSKAPSINPDRA